MSFFSLGFEAFFFEQKGWRVNILAHVAQELKLRLQQVEAVVSLLNEDATVPFIARYRKEATGSLDEVAITAIRNRLSALQELNKRRDAILVSLTERDLLTEELKVSLEQAESLPVLEDIYLPYRPKRRTRASMARERGLEALAQYLFRQEKGDPATHAALFINLEKQVPDAASALAGARDILAEQFAEDSKARERLRAVFERTAILRSKVVPGKEEEAATYRDYFAWEESVARIPSHRTLAMFRGENEGMLRLSLRPADETKAVEVLTRLFVRNDTPCGREVFAAVEDGYARLLAPALETEWRHTLKQKADTEAIRVFAENVRQLLLAPPLGAKIILAIDPGFRTGCKIVCLNREGKLLEYATINPHTGSENARRESETVLLDFVRRHAVETVAVGNGTAGRETEQFIRSLPNWPLTLPVVMVSENGASVYSASEIARAEFPDLDLTYRGAVSIGRRLADPLAELVKIDPKAIGVGQYQHDVNQSELKRCLDDVVMSCVNAVGVDVNTASEQLLTYVSGLGPTLARNIVAFRHENGPFISRKALLKVPRLGPKAFEQCSGFLRIQNAKNPLDGSAVHPESYTVVEKMAADVGATVKALIEDAGLRKKVDLSRYIDGRFGLPTLNDIMGELEKPGRDPRASFQPFAFAEGVSTLDDLKPGMCLPGIVTNITAFGAFVDIGVHQDGLVHISQLADRFVKDPGEIVKVHQEVRVTVLDVDKARKRIALTLRAQKENA